MRVLIIGLISIVISMLIGFGCSGAGVYSGPTGEISWTVNVESGEDTGHEIVLLRGLLSGEKIESNEVRSLKVSQVLFLDRENSLVARHESVIATIEEGAICIRLDKPTEMELFTVECSLTIWLKEPRHFRVPHYQGMFTSRIPVRASVAQSEIGNEIDVNFNKQ
jgi:hypothetical protein